MEPTTTCTAQISATLTYSVTKTLPSRLVADPATASDAVRDILTHDDLSSLELLLGEELELTAVTTTIS